MPILEEMKNIKADIMTMLDEIRNGKAKDEEERISAEVAKRVDEKLNDNLLLFFTVIYGYA